MSRPGSGAGASFNLRGMLFGVLGRVDGGDEDEVRWARGSQNSAEVTEISEGCNIVDAKWLCKCKGDSFGMVDRAEARMVTIGYSQVERVCIFKRLPL